jgi:trehalose synthase
MRDVGLDADWHVIHGRDEFFAATKQMHNALQGDPRDLSAEQWSTWAQFGELNAEALHGDLDICFVHDPQPAPLMRLAPQKAAHWLWRCHIDLSTPNPATIERLLPYIADYPDTVFHLAEYVPAGLSGRVHVIPPAIDPLAPKNMGLSPDDAAYVCQQFGVDVDRPLLVQVSRFDPWKDPLGVIDAYRAVKQDLPGVQLALVGSMASDDPEGWEFFNATVEHAGDDEDIKILNNFNGVGSIEINAFQVHADVVIQKSTREGFGLTVTEALWKGRPFVGGSVGGIPLQVIDGETGFLVDSPATCAERCLELLRDPGLARELGRAGKEHARRHFLTPRYLRDYLRVFSAMVDGA